MGRSDYYKGGDWNSECDVCGQKYKYSKLRRRWDGVLVCPKDWEPRHPQDFVKGVKDNQSVPETRAEPPDSFVPINFTLSPQLQDPSGDKVAISDVVTKVVSYVRLPSDSVLSGDQTVFVVGKALSDSVLSAESIALLFNGSRLFSDSVVETDSTIVLTRVSGSSLNGGALNMIPLG